VLTVVSRLAYLAFGFASEEEAAVMIVLSFTVCFYGSVLGLAYTYKLSWLGMRGILRMTTDNERAELLTEPWRAPGGWKPDLEQHQFGASLLCILVAIILLSNMVLIGLRRMWRRRSTIPSPALTHPAVIISSSEPS
jgi:membrane protein DedA with SNARE-associated domain